jgi:hypothetical protein
MIGTILQGAQQVITIASRSLIGRTSLGTGGPEQVGIGTGLALSGTTLVANGQDHAGFVTAGTLGATAELVISDGGTPKLLPAGLLRGLFAAGPNIMISGSGTISSTGSASAESGTSIGSLQAIPSLTSQDLVAVSQSGTDRAISYGNFVNGATVDQLQPAAAAGDNDTAIVSQGSSAVARQSFAAIWTWIARKLPGYRQPVVEIGASLTLDGSVHNGRILVCSQPVTISPSASLMGSGFSCTLVNAASTNVTLGTGFLTSSGSMALAPSKVAFIFCVTYSGGTITIASIA